MKALVKAAPHHKLRVHPALAVFPAQPERELSRLALDIRDNGLVNPLVVRGDELLDGRARLIACDRAKVEPSFTEYTGADPIGFITRANARRHMTQVQRAYAAAQLLTVSLETEGVSGETVAKDLGVSPETEGVSGETVAKDLGVSRAFVFRFKKLMSCASPDVVASVVDGRVRFADALRESGGAEPSRSPDLSSLPKIAVVAERLQKKIAALSDELRAFCAEPRARKMLDDTLLDLTKDLYAIADGSAYAKEETP